MKNFLIKTVTVFFVAIIVSINLCFFEINNAWAHRPHDVVTHLRVSPNYQQNKTLFIIVRHNLFKSEDSGKSWQRIFKGLDNLGYFSGFVGNEKNDQVMYVSSTWDGVYKSEDGGNNWFKVNNGLDSIAIEHLTIDSSSENILLASAKNNVYLTDNAGNDWRKILISDGKINQIAVNQNTIIVGDNQSNVSISSDFGKNWQSFDFFKSKDIGNITSILINPTDSNNFWIATQKQGVWETKDKGNSFSAINDGLSDLYVTKIITDNTKTLYATTYTEGFFVKQNGQNKWVKQSDGLTTDIQSLELKLPNFEVVAKSNSDMYLGGFDGLFQSRDSGKTWQPIETLSLGTVVALDISPNYANDQTVALVTYVGNFYLSQDGGKTWKSLIKGLEIPRIIGDFKLHGKQHPRRFFDMAFSPNYAQDNTVFSALLWSKIGVSTNNAQSWEVVPLPKEVRGSKIVVSPNFAQDKTVFITNQFGTIFKSVDGGKSFFILTQIERVFGNNAPSLVISSNFAEDKTLYITTQKGIFKSVDGGENWASVTTTEIEGKVNLQLAISPNYQIDQTLVLGTNEGVYKTENGGQTWQNVPIANLGKNAYLEAVAISPNYANDQTVLISVRGKGLFKSTDKGNNFVAIGNNSFPFMRMTQVPSAGIPLRFSPTYATDNTIYSFGSATTEVFKSTDGGETWQTLPIPINPISENEKYDLKTNINIWFDIYHSRMIRIASALFIGIAAYFLIGFLRLEKKIPLSKVQIKMISSFLFFAVGLILLYK